LEAASRPKVKLEVELWPGPDARLSLSAWRDQTHQANIQAPTFVSHSTATFCSFLAAFQLSSFQILFTAS